MKTKATVTCLTCRKPVEVTLIPYGESHIAGCPECNKLAVNE